MIKAINHIQITIPSNSETIARAFYCDLLGLEEIEKPDILKPNGGFWLQLGELQIHIGVEDGVERFNTKAHLGYEVSDLAHWRNKILENDIELFECKPIDGMNRFEFRDPFGNRVELLELCR